MFYMERENDKFQMQPDFAIRMSLPAVFWNFVFSDISIIKHRPFRLQKSGSYFWERVDAG